MKTLLPLLLIACGILCPIIFGYNLFTILFMTILCFLGGVFSGGVQSTDNKNADNLSALAQIERNKYFRGPDGK